jgi:hypothetical protein
MPASLNQTRHAMFPLAMKNWPPIPAVQLEALASGVSRRPVQRSILSSPMELWATSRVLQNRSGSLVASESSCISPQPSADPGSGAERLSEQAFRMHGPAFRARHAREHGRVPPRLLAPEEALKRLSGMSRSGQIRVMPETASALQASVAETPHSVVSSDAQETAASDALPAADDSEGRVRALLKQALDTCSAQIITLLDGGANLSNDDRQTLLAKIIQLYGERDIGKGFSSLVHNLWTILENDNEALDIERLRLCRDTLERLYANPRFTYEQARALRRDLKTAGLPVENRELRKVILDALASSRA